MKIRKVYKQDVLDYARKFSSNNFNKYHRKNKYKNQNRENMNFITFTDIINFQENIQTKKEKDYRNTMAGNEGVFANISGNSQKNKLKPIRFSVDTKSLGNSRLSARTPESQKQNINSNNITANSSNFNTIQPHSSQNPQSNYQKFTLINNIKYKRSTKKCQTQQSINPQFVKMMAIYEKIRFFYYKLSILYKTNEQKLLQIILRHIKFEYYIFSKQIIEVIKNFKTANNSQMSMIKDVNNKQANVLRIFCHSQSKKIYNELIKFKDYLESFYEKKCVKNIQIIEANILARERAIRDNTPFQKYQIITKSFRPCLITKNIDIVEELRQISQGNGTFKELSKVQNSLFKKLKETEAKISKVFNTVCNRKEQGAFAIDDEDI